MEAMNHQVQLSIVVAARNDNYGGDFTSRLQRCLNWCCYCCEKFQLPAEFLIVNWNPVRGERQLVELLNLPLQRRFFSVRFITVSEEIHKALSDTAIRKPLPLYEYLAKNAGIVRAKGEFILAANPDVSISPEIFSLISSGYLNNGSYYKTDRIDFHNPSDFDWSNETGFMSAKKNMFRVFLKGWSYPISHSNWRIKLKGLRRINHARVNWFLWLNKLEPYVINYGIELYPHNVEYYCHCNASGDFMLMHRSSWFALRAYPENRWLPLHTDALFVAMANTSGLREIVFDETVFHQEHGRRFEASKHTTGETRNEYLKFQVEGKEMISQKKPMIANNIHWGLQNEILPEIVL